MGVLSRKKVTGDHRGVLEDSVGREAAARPDWAGSDPLAQWKAIEAGGKEEEVPGLPSCPHIAAAPTSSSLLLRQSRQMTAPVAVQKVGIEERKDPLPLPPTQWRIGQGLPYPIERAFLATSWGGSGKS